MDQKLIGSALLAGLAAFLLDGSSAAFLRGQIMPWLGPIAPLGAVLPELTTAAGILCLVAILILWLRPH